MQLSNAENVEYIYIFSKIKPLSATKRVRAVLAKTTKKEFQRINNNYFNRLKMT